MAAEKSPQNLHSYFNEGNVFILVGILLFSVLICVQSLFFTPPSYIKSRQVAAFLFGLTSISAVVGLSIAKIVSRYVFYRDGLPFLLLPLSLILSGNASRGPLLLLAIAIAANILFALASGKTDEVDESKDLVRLYFRWPF